MLPGEGWALGWPMAYGDAGRCRCCAPMRPMGVAEAAALERFAAAGDALLPPQDPANVPWKILMDQTVYCASKYSAYLYLSGLASGSSVHECQEEVTSKLWPTLTTGWKFWPAVHLITYNIIPPRHRVLWINMVDLAWVTFLSMVARQGSGNEQQPVLEEEEEEGPTARRAPARGGGRQALKASRR